jgi:hypothetical protein
LDGRNVSGMLNSSRINDLLMQLGTRPATLKAFCDDTLRSPSSFDIRGYVQQQEVAPATDLGSWIALAQEDIKMRTLLNQIIQSENGTLSLSDLPRGVSGFVIVEWIKKQGHLVSINLNSGTVQPYSHIHWRLMKQHGIILPARPLGLRPDLPPKNMTLEEFAETVGLDADDLNALKASKVSAGGTLGLCSFLAFV